MSTPQRLIATLLLVLALVGGFGLGWMAGGHQGRADGKQLAQGQAAQETVDALTQVISAHKSLTAQAAQASRELRAATAARLAADTQSTKEFQDALARTESSRTGCVFPVDVVRQLAAARDRAAQAAAHGIREPLPSAAPQPNQR